MAYYYRDYGGPAIGPASESEMKELAKRGIIAPTTEVRVGMSPKWFAATKIPGIRFTAPPDDSEEEPPTVTDDTLDTETHTGIQKTTTGVLSWKLSLFTAMVLNLGMVLVGIDSVTKIGTPMGYLGITFIILAFPTAILYMVQIYQAHKRL